VKRGLRDNKTHKSTCANGGTSNGGGSRGRAAVPHPQVSGRLHLHTGGREEGRSRCTKWQERKNILVAFLLPNEHAKCSQDQCLSKLLHNRDSSGDLPLQIGPDSDERPLWWLRRTLVGWTLGAK